MTKTQQGHIISELQKQVETLVVAFKSLELEHEKLKERLRSVTFETRFCAALPARVESLEKARQAQLGENGKLMQYTRDRVKSLNEEIKRCEFGLYALAGSVRRRLKYTPICWEEHYADESEWSVEKVKRAGK